MWFIENILKIPAVTGLIFVLMSLLLFKKPPKKINQLYGYRTKNSMKSQEAWVFSQKYASVEFIKLGFFLIVISLTGFIYNYSIIEELVIGLLLIIASPIYSIYKIESVIKKRYGTKDE